MDGILDRGACSGNVCLGKIGKHGRQFLAHPRHEEGQLTQEVQGIPTVDATLQPGLGLERGHSGLTQQVGTVGKRHDGGGR